MMSDDSRIFTQYRQRMKPYEPLLGRKYTITHSDTTAELFVFIGENYAKDQFTIMRDEVCIRWERSACGLRLMGEVMVNGEKIVGDAGVRNEIFLREMPKALHALRHADRFLFERECKLDATPVYIYFRSTLDAYAKMYDLGKIGRYRSCV